MKPFEWPVRVYYEDTDSGGVVYHANYLKFMERARTEWLRSLGFAQSDLLAEHGCVFAVHSMHLNFRKPARFNDALRVCSELIQLRRASMSFKQWIMRGEQVLCDAEVKVACLDANTFQPCPIPMNVLMEMQHRE